ncbi:hypothetical protein BK742_22515 [Bacillus thuringiensis serovar pingluonsis]|uniref:Histidine phosphatase family protein n=1 Tax=Bacillus thuringiensis serovar pingluonsis TaxID=180881 RepID=A0A243B355_BACTU|nr:MULTISPECIES: histidine phosphatase family protein [Bacillus cereus group]MEB9680324.1 histidine phosphatase family protein [Bacillus anthracis]OTY38432.1 hypothetical protein BK742_22515 [Bacillus thuringiensis serovar pingluonsis]
MNYSEIPFEVKLLLDANQVLTEENQLQLDQLDMEIQEIEMFDILFLDTPNLTLYQNGWIIRGRLKPNKDEWELTFKYRIKLSQSEEPSIALEQALQAAASSGFDLSDPNYELELEWSEEQKTLSLSYKVNIPIASPDRSEAWRNLIMQHAPQPLRLKEWERLDFAELVNQLNVLGPIRAQKNKGNWHGLKTSVESWYITNGTIVEISLKAKGGEDAREKREQMKQQLKDKKLMTGQSFSKTQWALWRIISPTQNPFSLLQTGGYNLYFRHSQPENTRSENASLSETGLKQARKIGRLFVDRHIPFQIPVRSSPINRAKETAQIAFGEEQIQLEERLIQPELPQLLESTPEVGKNQVFIAHHYTFDNQLAEKLDYMNMVLIKPLGAGSGYRLEQVYDLLAESIIRYDHL